METKSVIQLFRLTFLRRVFHVIFNTASESISNSYGVF